MTTIHRLVTTLRSVFGYVWQDRWKNPPTILPFKSLKPSNFFTLPFHSFISHLRIPANLLAALHHHSSISIFKNTAELPLINDGYPCYDQGPIMLSGLKKPVLLSVSSFKKNGWVGCLSFKGVRGFIKWTSLSQIVKITDLGVTHYSYLFGEMA